MSAIHVTSHLKLSVEKGDGMFLNVSADEEEEDEATEGGFSEEKGADSEEDSSKPEGEEEEEEDITKIVIKHTHDAPPNIGLLENKMPPKETDVQAEVANMNDELRRARGRRLWTTSALHKHGGQQRSARWGSCQGRARWAEWGCGSRTACFKYTDKRHLLP